MRHEINNIIDSFEKVFTAANLDEASNYAQNQVQEYLNTLDEVGMCITVDDGAVYLKADSLTTEDYRKLENELQDIFDVAFYEKLGENV